MKANLARITFAAGTIAQSSTAGLSTHAFVPLADVPDRYGSAGRTVVAAPKTRIISQDMDAPRAAGTLLELCKKDPKKNVAGCVQKYYDNVKDQSRGLLPFRVQQF